MELQKTLHIQWETETGMETKKQNGKNIGHTVRNKKGNGNGKKKKRNGRNLNHTVRNKNGKGNGNGNEKVENETEKNLSHIV
jgi:hypothetical protein